MGAFDRESLEQLATEHNLDEIHQFKQCSLTMQELADQGIAIMEAKGTIDYVDMITLPCFLPAKVRGRDIGNQLIKEINAVYDHACIMGNDEPEFDKFLYWMERYEMRKKGQWDELDYRDKLSEMLEDRLNAIAAIYNSLTSDYSIKGLKDKAKSLFTDSDTFVILSTVHRAKGLEAERVFILEPDEMPLVWRHQKQWEYRQELNLLYVALTRSKSELYLMDKAAWYKEGRVTEDVVGNV